MKTDFKKKIIDTALRLFSDKGYFNTSLQDIRKEANVSIGGIYHHFKNKEEIASAFMMKWSTGLIPY